VTLTSVLNDQAATVGTAFACLLGAGFAFERAMQFARRRVMMGKDYAVVGDGTFAVVPPHGHPDVLRVERSGDAYEAEYEVVSPRAPGRRYPDPFGGAERLYGRSAAATLDAEELRSLCRERSFPVLFDGEVRGPDDLATDLASRK
jgi:hypothetical protein